jgi:hypothetical protein
MNTRSQSRPQQPTQKAAATPKTMENLETELNHAIQSRGFRISERLPLRERLTRYIDLTCRSRVDLDTDELNSVSELILMKYSPTDTNETITPQVEQPKKTRTVKNELPRIPFVPSAVFMNNYESIRIDAVSIRKDLDKARTKSDFTAIAQKCDVLFKKAHPIVEGMAVMLLSDCMRYCEEATLNSEEHKGAIRVINGFLQDIDWMYDKSTSNSGTSDSKPKETDAKLDLLKDICTKRNIQWKDELYDMYLSYRKSCGSNGKNRYDIMNTFLDKYANGITNKRRSPRLASQ